MPPPVGGRHLHRPAPRSADARRQPLLTGGRYAPSPALAAQRPKSPPAVGYALLQRGLVLLLCERYDAAEEDLGLALQLHPGWARAHYLRGFAHKSTGQFEAAAADFHAASREVRVDYLHVYHVQLEADAILDEAGWQPMPTVLRLPDEAEAEDGDEEEGEAEEAAGIEQLVPAWSHATDGPEDDDEDEEDDDEDDEDEDEGEKGEEEEEEEEAAWPKAESAPIAPEDDPAHPRYKYRFHTRPK